MWLVQVGALSIVLLFLVVATLRWQYGSFRAACSVMVGQSLLVSPSPVVLGTVQPGTTVPFEVTVRNATGSPMTILGVDDCCSCRLRSKSPVEVSAYGQKSLLFAYTPQGTAGDAVHVSVPLLTTSSIDQTFVEIVCVLSLGPHLAEPR